MKLEAGKAHDAQSAVAHDDHRKFYVQDRMREAGRDLWAWLADGGCVYVCGDAKAMAKDVERALTDIVAHHRRVEGRLIDEFRPDSRCPDYLLANTLRTRATTSDGVRETSPISAVSSSPVNGLTSIFSFLASAR
jgi:hypothetical protein